MNIYQIQQVIHKKFTWRDLEPVWHTLYETSHHKTIVNKKHPPKKKGKAKEETYAHLTFSVSFLHNVWTRSA